PLVVLPVGVTAVRRRDDVRIVGCRPGAGRQQEYESGRREGAREGMAERGHRFFSASSKYILTCRRPSWRPGRRLEPLPATPLTDWMNGKLPQLSYRARPNRGCPPRA